LKMDEDLEKSVIETMPVVSSLCCHTTDVKNHVNLRCGCGVKQVGTVRKSSKRYNLMKKMLLMCPQNVLMMRELSHRVKIIQARAAQVNKTALEAEKQRDELHTQIEDIEEHLQPKREHSDADTFQVERESQLLV
jgi:hypothetical protein